MCRRSAAVLVMALAALTGGCGALEDAKSLALKAARDQAREEIEQAVRDTVKDALASDGVLPAPIDGLLDED